MMATMPCPRPVDSGLRLSCDSASSRVSLSRFLKAFSAPLSCSFVGPAGGVSSDIGIPPRMRSRRGAELRQELLDTAGSLDGVETGEPAERRGELQPLLHPVQRTVGPRVVGQLRPRQ